MIAVIAFFSGIAFGTIVGLWLADGPVCECGDVECGGGCIEIDWNNAT